MSGLCPECGMSAGNHSPACRLGRHQSCPERLQSQVGAIHPFHWQCLQNDYEAQHEYNRQTDDNNPSQDSR